MTPMVSQGEAYTSASRKGLLNKPEALPAAAVSGFCTAYTGEQARWELVAADVRVRVHASMV